MTKRQKTRQRAACRRPGARATSARSPVAKKRRAPKAPPRPSAAVRKEFRVLLRAIDDELLVGIRLQQWPALTDAVTAYAAMFGVDPAVLLCGSILRQLARHAMTVTDPGELAAIIVDMREGVAAGSCGLSLTDVVRDLAQVSEHRPAFRAFYALGVPGGPDTKH